jgi:hypothetical protein
MRVRYTMIRRITCLSSESYIMLSSIIDAYLSGFDFKQNNIIFHHIPILFLQVFVSWLPFWTRFNTESKFLKTQIYYCSISICCIEHLLYFHIPERISGILCYYPWRSSVRPYVRSSVSNLVSGA